MPPPGIEPLAVAQEGGDHGCTADRTWCAWFDQEKQQLRVTHDGLPAAEASYSPSLISALSDTPEATFSLWPHVIRVGDAVLAGVETEVSTGYSGGGAQATQLHLILFTPGRAAHRVLSVPTQANILIRACFSEADMKQRAGACHDEYNFSGTLVPDGNRDAGMPVLRYRTEATSYPGPVSRSEDSLAKPPLRKRDLITVADPRCSVERIFRFTPAADSYRPDEPLPDCSDYTVP